MQGDLEGVGNQRGIALVVAMLVLVFFSLLASALLVSLNVESKVTGRSMRSDQALNVAEAGGAEATERIRKGDIGTTMEPEAVWQIFLTPAGNVPAMGADTVAVSTWQDEDSWLAYSTPGRSSDVLTIRYKTDAKQKVIYRYDDSRSPAIQTSTGQPIYVIQSTGQVGDSKRTLVTEVIQEEIPIAVKGAAAGRRTIQIVKDSYLCGYNHRSDTPTWTGLGQGRNAENKSCNDDLPKKKWELGSGDIPGAWSEGVIVNDKKGDQYGSPVKLQAQEPPSWYAGPWEALQMTQAEFFAMMGDPIKRPGALVGNIDGMRFYDADGDPKTSDGTVDMRGVQGEGFLYIEGDLQAKGDFVYRGMIYVTGKVTIDERAWILGAVVCGDRLTLRGPDGEVVVLYSKDAITEGITRNGGPLRTLSWREMP